MNLGNVASNGHFSFALCDTEDVVFEGGYKVLSFSAEPGDIINTLYDGPSQLSHFVYQTQLTSNDEGLTFQAFVYCLNNPNDDDGGGGTGD